MSRTNYSSGSPWESVIGYSRAVRINNVIEVSGTVAVDENGQIVAKGDPYGQALFIYQKIEKTLQQAGSSMKDVIRIRMFVTDISFWQEFGKAHAVFFKDVKPCNSMIEVKGLIGPDYLVEIEASAVTS